MAHNTIQFYPVTVKILTTHQVVDGDMDSVMAIIETMRKAASDQSGYISTEVIEAQRQSNKVLVITAWRSIEDWNQWFYHPIRSALQESMDLHLDGTTAYTIFRDQ